MCYCYQREIYNGSTCKILSSAVRVTVFIVVMGIFVKCLIAINAPAVSLVTMVIQLLNVLLIWIQLQLVAMEAPVAYLGTIDVLSR